MIHKHYIQQAQVLIGAMTTVTVLVIALMLSYSPSPAIHTLTGINPPKIALADDPNWTQTDWSGGSGTSIVDEYASETDIDASTNSGQLSLDTNGEEFSNTDFESDLSDWGTAVQSWAFDNSAGQYITSGQVFSDLVDKTGDYSISVWFKSSNTTQQLFIMGNRYNGNSFFAVSKLKGGLLYISTGDNVNNGFGSQSRTASTYNDGNWHNLIISRDGDTKDLNLYLDGSLDSIQTFNNGTDQNFHSAFVIGTYSTGVASWDGNIADVIVWDTELSSDDVEDIYNAGIPRNEMNESLAGDIVGYWRAQNSTNVVEGVIDQSGNGYDGTMTSMSDEAITTDNPSGAITTRDTGTTYESSDGAAKIVTNSGTFDFTQSLNLGDTNIYTMTAYAYTDGSAVTSSDVELTANGSTLDTTYADMGSGWYQLTATTVGVASSRTYGAQVKASKTVYLDDFSLSRLATTGVLVSATLDASLPAQWGVVTYSTSGTGSVVLKARSDVTSDMSTATDWASCTAVTDSMDLTDNDCVTDEHQYLQYQVTLSTTDTTTSPIFEEWSLDYITDNIPPTINNIAATDIADSHATITWITNEEASSQVNYGVSTSYGTTTSETNIATGVLSHSQTISNLESCTTYNYRVRSTDAANNEGISNNQSFITQGCVGGGLIIRGGGKAVTEETTTTTEEETVETPIIETSGSTTTTEEEEPPAVTETSGSGSGGGGIAQPVTPTAPYVETTSESTTTPDTTTPKLLTLSIHVVDVNREPVRDAQVTLTNTHNPHFTNSQGNVTFRNLTPGDYTVVIIRNNQRGEQPITVDEDVKLTIQMNAVSSAIPQSSPAFSNTAFEPRTIERVRDFFRFCWLWQCEA